MRWNTHALPAMALGVLVCASASAEIRNLSAESYRGIPERNLFGLKSPAPVAAPQPAPPPALPKLILTGITTVLDNKRALIMGPMLSAGATDNAKSQSFILTEGQRDDYVEVVQINEVAGEVMVRNCGVPMTLTFDKDGPRLPATPAPAQQVPAPQVVPGTPPSPAMTAQAPPGNVPEPKPVAMPPGMRPVPLRGYRPAVSPEAAVAPLPTAQTNAATTAAATMPAPVPPTAPPATPTSQPLSPEEQALLLELTRQAQSQTEGAPPLPPTGFSMPRVYPESDGAAGSANRRILPQ